MQNYICSRCDYTGPKVRIKPGSTKMEVIWWCLFPIGPFYSAWRMLGRRLGCPQCGETVMVPVRSKDEILFSREAPAEQVEDLLKPREKPRRSDTEVW